MKKAFTLAEALITLGIIGIISALTMPMINQAKPYDIKIKYLNTYDALAQMVSAYVNNTKEYPICGYDAAGTNAYNFKEGPFLNLYGSILGSVSQSNGWTNNSKLCRLIAWGFDADNANCTNSAYNTNPGSNPNNYWTPSFAARSGVLFSVLPRTSTQVLGNNASRFGVNVIVDVNGASEPNCLYNPAANSGVCHTHPDRFWFMITADGQVHPADPMGQAFIDTRKTSTIKNIDSVVQTKSYYSWVNSHTPAANQVSTTVTITSCQ